jgi:hypothetical protein
MATPRRPGRPARPGSTSARRRPVADEEEPLLDENGEPLDEAPPAPKGPSVTMIVGLGAALLFAILLIMLISSKRGYLIEVENMSENPLQKVSVKVNGVTYEIGDMRPNEIGGAQAKCTPGNDIEVEYKVPNRSVFVKRLPKKDKDGNGLDLDLADYKGRLRIRLQPEGIAEIEY